MHIKDEVKKVLEIRKEVIEALPRDCLLVTEEPGLEAVVSTYVLAVLLFRLDATLWHRQGETI